MGQSKLVSVSHKTTLNYLQSMRCRGEMNSYMPSIASQVLAAAKYSSINPITLGYYELTSTRSFHILKFIIANYVTHLKSLFTINTTFSLCVSGV